MLIPLPDDYVPVLHDHDAASKTRRQPSQTNTAVGGEIVQLGIFRFRSLPQPQAATNTLSNIERQLLMKPSSDEDPTQSHGLLHYLGQLLLSIMRSTSQMVERQTYPQASGAPRTRASVQDHTQERSRPKVTGGESRLPSDQDGDHVKSDETDDVLGRLVHQISSLSTAEKNHIFDAVYQENPRNDNLPPQRSGSGWMTPWKNRPEVSEATFIEMHKKWQCSYEREAKRNAGRFRSERDDCRERLDAVRAKLDQERKHAEATQAQAEQHINMLQTKIAELSHVHVRSVNGIDAGLEPISDKTFTEALADYHVKTYQWCRMNLRTKKLLDHDRMPEGVQEIIKHRCGGAQPTDLKAARVADLIIWFGLEQILIRQWFPVRISPGQECGLEHMEREFARQGSGPLVPKTCLKLTLLGLPDHSQRIEFWRGYTACLAFQSSGFSRAIDDAVDSFVAISARHILALLDGSHEVDHDALREVIHPIFMTGAEMKCQRGLYEIEPLEPGVLFDEDTMEDAEMLEFERGVQMVVKVVLSSGIVKRPYRGSPEIVGRARKPLVLICAAK